MPPDAFILHWRGVNTKSRVMSIAICLLMITSVSGSIMQNVGQSQNHIQLGPSPASGGSGGLEDSPWPTLGQNTRHTGLSPYDTSANPGTEKWNFTTGYWIGSSPAIGSDGTIYVGSYDHKLYAINPDGSEKWNYTTNAQIRSSPAIDSDGTIYIGSDDYELHAINSDGTKKWNFTTGGLVPSSPTIDSDGTIYVGSYDNKLYAINPDGTEKWSFTTGHFVGASSPAIGSDGTIYIGSYDNKLYAINPDGTEKWSFTTDGSVRSPAIGSDNTIYVGSNDKKLYAINPDGSEKWSFITGGGIQLSPAIGLDNTIYVGSEDNNLYAINPNGIKKWNFTTGGNLGSTQAIGSDGTIFVGSHDGKLYAINPDGSERWSFNINSRIWMSPAIGSDGTIYVGCQGKRSLYAIGNISLGVNVTSHFSELNSAAQSSITVHVTDGTNPVQGATVNLVSDNGGIFSPQSGITDANGDFKSIFNAPTITTEIICRISAEASKIGYNGGSGYVDITLIPIPWPMFSQNCRRTGLSPYDTSSNPGKLKWSFTTEGIVLSPVIGSDGTIYVGSYSDKLYAINPDGTEKWNYTIGKYMVKSLAIGSDGSIYAGSTKGIFFALNPDGTEKWQFNTEGQVRSSPAIGSDGSIYFGTGSGSNLYHLFFALNPDGTEKWRFVIDTGGQTGSPGIGLDGTIYFGSSDGNLYALNPDGTEKWRFTAASDNVQSAPAIDSDGTIYVGSRDHNLYAIYPNGTEKWRFTTGDSICCWDTSVAIGSDGTIYIGSDDKNLYAINQDGTERWRFPADSLIETAPAIGSEGTIYFGSLGIYLYAIHPDGSEKWNFTTGWVVTYSPAIGSDGTIYVGSWDGKLYAIGAPNPDITVEKTANVTTAEPGDLIEYTIYYNNTGPGEAETVWINDTLPDGVTFVTSNAEGNRTGNYNWTFNNIASYTKMSWSGPYLPTTRPSPRYDHSMAYDAINNKVVLFGGYDGSNYDDTWEYNTVTHTWYGPYLPTRRPPGGFGHSMAYDSTNNRIVLFSGYDVSYHDETWEYDTATHTWYGPYLPATRPSLRYDHAMAYDSTNNRIVLFGGRFGSTYFDETWEYDTATHTWYGPFQPSICPSGRIEHAMTYDSVNNRIVLFGGDDGSLNDETWEYDTATHTWYGSYLPVTRPSSRYATALIYDSVIKKIVLFGGLDIPKNDETWEYDTSTHTWDGPYLFTTQPSARNDHAMAFDSGNNRIILFGGMVGVPPTFSYNDETWESTRETTTHSFNIIVRVNSGIPNGTILTNYVHLDYTDSQGNLMLDSSDSVDVLVLAPENQPPIADAGPDQIVNEGDTVQFDVSSSYDPDGIIETYQWDFDSSDGLWWETGATPDAIDPTPTHTYGDDGVFIVTLRVTDNDNLSATDTCNITVQNVDPTVTIDSITLEVEIGLRVAGRKYNDVSMTLYEEGSQLGYVSIERMPGSPNEQIAWIPVSINFSKSYNATVIYTPEDPPNIGANPVWIYIKSKNGSINKIHHTFNVQQSKKRDSEHWNHVEPWEVDLNGHFIGLPIEITSYITDPGSDDETLTITYGTQSVTVVYLNNPLNPDPYPSPEVNPRDFMDTTILVYEGPGTVTLVVKDDDNIRLGVGEGTDSIWVA